MCQDGYIPNEFLLTVDIWRAQVLTSANQYLYTVWKILAINIVVFK